VQRSVIGGGLLSFDGLEEEVADAAGFKGARRLQVLELEEDATWSG